MKKIPRRIKPIKRVEGEIDLPGDKSISHRAVMVGSIAKGKTNIKNFLNSEDCKATTEAFKEMGVKISSNGVILSVEGVGLRGLRRPSSTLYVGNSGTSMRLLLGILAGQDFRCTLSGDASLSNRPMRRVTVPLRQMGADIQGGGDANFAPLTIKGGNLHSIDYMSPIASAQVKSAILFAGLYADGTTSVTEHYISRDHTERMLKFFGANVAIHGLKVSVRSTGLIDAKDIHVPGDISSSAFFIVAALLLKGSKLVIRNVGFNPTRNGIVDILRRMGAKIEIRNLRDDWEPLCDLMVQYSVLKATTVLGSEIPRTIDELPILMVAAAFADGCTVIKGAGELRVKETDRINSMVLNLNKMGVDIRCEGNDVYIVGAEALEAVQLSSFGDHRTAMALTIAALRSSKECIIDDVKCIDTSFPRFFDFLESISKY